MYTYTEQLPRMRHMPTVFRRALSIPLNTSLGDTMWHYTCPRGWTMRLPPNVFWKMISTNSRCVPSRDPPPLGVSSRYRKPFIKISLTKASDCTLRFRRFRLWLSEPSNGSRSNGISVSDFRIDKSAVVIAAFGGRNSPSRKPLWIEKHAFPAAATRIPRLP